VADPIVADLSMRDDDDVEEEWVVAAINGHHGRGARRRYHVLWVGGATTEEPMQNLIDVENGEEVINEELLKYWKVYPSLKQQ
jgi:hypothetical protein